MQSSKRIIDDRNIPESHTLSGLGQLTRFVDCLRAENLRVFIRVGTPTWAHFKTFEEFSDATTVPPFALTGCTKSLDTVSKSAGNSIRVVDTQGSTVAKFFLPVFPPVQSWA